ncbi:hypothetical protein BH23CHL2_BH23CHL2_33550 [soil metagenome]
MSLKSSQEIQPYMEVFTADAIRIGRVKKVREDDILIDREHARDVFLPFRFVNLVITGEQRVDLSITEAEYNDHDWENPDLL